MMTITTASSTRVKPLRVFDLGKNCTCSGLPTKRNVANPVNRRETGFPSLFAGAFHVERSIRVDRHERLFHSKRFLTHPLLRVLGSTIAWSLSAHGARRMGSASLTWIRLRPETCEKPVPPPTLGQRRRHPGVQFAGDKRTLGQDCRRRSKSPSDSWIWGERCTRFPTLGHLGVDKEHRDDDQRVGPVKENVKAGSHFTVKRHPARRIRQHPRRHDVDSS